MAEPIGLVDAARLELDQQVAGVLDLLSVGNGEAAATALLDPGYLASQEEFAGAVDGQIADLAADMEVKTSADRLSEVHSVAVALVLFTMAIGAWAIFGRNLRRSRRRLAEEHERRLRAEAESAQMQKMEALGMMADGVAHDVKNLTVVISGSAEEVRKGLPDGHPGSVALARIEQATRQADDMAQALLAFSRKAECPKGVVDLAAVAVGMTQLLRYMVPPPIELTVEAPQAAWVHGDAVQLQQVILNLAANARDAMPSGGRLAVSVRPARSDAGEDGSWLLVVEDTGCGMTADVVDRLFEPFFTTRRAGQGSGLGLTIVRRTVSDHGGWIDVATVPGEGTTFTIGLPAADPPHPAAGDDGGGSLVLVANAAPNVRDLISGVLVAEGYRTVTASSVDELGACFTGRRPAVDLAVIDSQLLVGHGLSVPPSIPVVLTGAAGSARDLEGHPDLCVVGEPLSLATLAECVMDRLRPADSLVPS